MLNCLIFVGRIYVVMHYISSQVPRVPIALQWLSCFAHLLLFPVKRGYCFRFVCLSVCLSVRLSVCPGRSFSHFVRVTPPTVFTTHKPNLYHLKAGCLECVMGGSVFSYRPKFRRNRSLKTAQNHKF